MQDKPAVTACAHRRKGTMSTATEDTTKANGAALDSKTLVARPKKAGELEVSGAEPAEIWS